MDHERQPAGKPFFSIDIQLFANGIGYLSPNDGCVYASFFEDPPAGHDLRPPSATMFPLPFIGDENRFAVQLFKGGADAVLEIMDEADPAVPEAIRIGLI